MNLLDLCNDVLVLILHASPDCYKRLSLTCKRLAGLRDPRARTRWRTPVVTADEEYCILPSRQIDGEYVRYYDAHKKNVHVRANYDNGVLHGPYEVCYPNGSLKRLLHFERGKLHGLYLEWNVFFQLEREVSFSDDLLHGAYYVRYGSSFVERAHYVRGRRHGHYEFCDKSLSISANYHYGRLDGAFQKQTRDALVVGKYQRGKKHGRFFKLKDQKVSVVDYVRGQRHGDYKFRDNSSCLRVVGKYVKNARDGEWVYSVKERVLEKRVYENRKLVQRTRLPGQAGEETWTARADTFIAPDILVRWNRAHRLRKIIFQNQFFEFFAHGDPWKMRRSGSYIKKNGHLLLHGQVQVYDATGYMLVYAEYSNGQRHGRYIEFERAHTYRIAKYVEYQHDRISGRIFQLSPAICGTFAPRGSYFYVFEQNNAVIYESESTIVEYDKQLRQVVAFYHKDGACFGYYENYALQFSGRMKNGRLHGQFTEWYSNGTPRLQCTFCRGRVVGARKVWRHGCELDVELP